MKRLLYRRGGWVLLLLLALVYLIATPVSAARQVQQQLASTTTLKANVYLTTESLKSMFQDKINQQVANLSNSMMNKMLSNLPAADQVWARAMAGALIQPTATLTQLTPQSAGLDTRLSLSLYPGDPKPIDAAMLVTFSVRDASTIQVSGQSISGSPQLVNGPLATLTVPIGQLQSINTTPDCGNAGLKTDIQLPVNVNTANGQVAQSALADTQQRQVVNMTMNRAANALNSYVEITNNSLKTFGGSIGPIGIGSITIVPWDPNDPLTAENLQISTQGNGLGITADIYIQRPVHTRVATAIATVQPSAVNGQLVMTVTSLQVKLFGIASLPDSATASYKTQLQNMLNNNLGNALVGKFTVNGVGVGGGAALPCAQSDSLILQGTIGLG